MKTKQSGTYWKAVETEVSRRLDVVDDRGKLVAMIPVEFGDETEALANQKLVAEAPALKWAAKRAYRHIDTREAATTENAVVLGQLQRVIFDADGTQPSDYSPTRDGKHIGNAATSNLEVWIAFADVQYEESQVISVCATRAEARQTIRDHADQRKQEGRPAQDGYHTEAFRLGVAKKRRNKK